MNNTKTYKSSWEKLVANCLRKEKIKYIYEPCRFPINNYLQYTPDFVLENAVNGKRVILEPHGVMKPEHFSKFALFRKTSGKDYFLILLVKNDLIPFIPRDSYDDIWPIEYAFLLAKRLKERTRIVQSA
jgi:hypothetical protein